MTTVPTKSSDDPSDGTVVWPDDNAKDIFSGVGAIYAEELMALGPETPGIAYQPMGEHRDKSTGETLRSIAMINVGGRCFFLKRAWGAAFGNIVAELKAIEILPSLGWRPPGVAARYLDHDKKMGCALLAELEGYYPVSAIIKGDVPDAVVEDVRRRGDWLLGKIAAVNRKIKDAGFAYPDFVAKHIFIKPGSEELALIDLERFRDIRDFPWYFRFPVLSYFTRRKIWKKQLKSLASDLWSGPLPKKLPMP